jgi:methionine synthase I (cobalamin-dependent)
VRHARPVTIGLNCSFGAQQLTPHIQTLGPDGDTLIQAYPNAGLPYELGAYDERPDQTAELVPMGGGRGLVNILGGCLRLVAGPHRRHRRGGARHPPPAASPAAPAAPAWPP